MRKKLTRPPEPAEPPSPPQLPPRIRIGRVQAVGVPLLALLPAIALTGLLGEREGHAGNRSATGVSLQVDYPEVLRYRTTHGLDITVRNEGAAPLAEASLQIDQSYLKAFTRPQMTPTAQRVTQQHQEVPLGPLAPGEVRRVVATLEADNYGSHSGRVRLAAPAGVDVAVDVSTLVLP